MDVKGTAVIPVAQFVQDKFPDRKDEWISSLSETSANIMKSALTGGWYPLQEGLIEPTQKICDLFYAGKEEGAFELGRYSAEQGLKGVYKLFVKLGSPSFIISRGSQILPTYYKGSALQIVEETKNSVVLHITCFPGINRITELRIAGWMERALSMSGGKNIKIDITRSLAKGDAVTEYKVHWD